MDIDRSPEDSSTTVLGPLLFPETSQPDLPFSFAPWERGTCSCIQCPQTFELPHQKDLLLAHLYHDHKLVIADVDLIASLKGYLDYWRIRLTQKPDILVGFGRKNDYVLLSELTPGDDELRKGLAAKRLEWVLECQTKEREERNYNRGCLFCRHVETGTRANYLNHLSYQHNLQLGRPDNLVFIDKFLDKIEEKMKQLKCIYCELVFKDRVVLKEHMRKKFHKRVNPKNKEYDCFYVISYLEGNGGRDEGEPPEEEDTWSQWREEGSDWSDWQEEPYPIVCLFCQNSFTEWETILQHMGEVHKFSYRFIMGQHNFYDQLKIVNFIRREVHLNRCYECKEKFPDRAALTEHMDTQNHCTIPDRVDWDHSEFYFPTYENDTFLCLLEDNEEDPIERLSHQMTSNWQMAE